MLKKCRVSSEPILWQKSLATGEIPDMFKMAFVIPIHKPSNPRSTPGSYRPVSLTSQLVKTFERVLKKSFQNFLEVTLALNDGQHGFRARRSCSSQLLSYYDTIISGMEDGNNVDTVYLDYA